MGSLPRRLMAFLLAWGKCWGELICWDSMDIFNSMISFFMLLSNSKIASSLELLFWVCWGRLSGFRLQLWVPVVVLLWVVVLLVPVTCLSLQSSVRHSPALRDWGHIMGWKLLQFSPLHPRGPLFPCCVSFLQAFGCCLGQPVPDIP